MTKHLRVPSELEDHLSVDTGSVFFANQESDDWNEIIAELTEAFEMTRDAMQHERGIVYIVHHADLLGQRGAGPAMVATGLLSGARTAAFEGRKAGIPVNVLAIDGDEPAQTLATWCRNLLERGGPTGELVRLGGSHLGKALP